MKWEYKSVTFKGLSGADSLRVGSPNAATPGRSDLLTVNVIVDAGGSAGDTLIMDDRADPTGRLVTTTPTLIGSGPNDNLMGKSAKVQYTGFNNGSVQFLFGPGTDELRYDDTAATAATTYTLAGNRSCEPNNPPIAQLAASPESGPAPLSVSFDGSGSSDPDLCDTVASYTFDFGDGTPPATQATPTVLHTYRLDGEFSARLTVTDSRGKASANAAQRVITVEGGSPDCPAGGFCFYTVPPCRVFDSRSGSPLGSGAETAVQVGSKCGVPISAKAVALNVTVVGATDPGFLSVYANAGGPPATSTLNFGAGQVRANNAVCGLSSGGQGTLEVFPAVGSQGTVHVVIDVDGYFQ